MASFPNQRDIKIHKPKYDGNFVSVDIYEWQEAYATLTRSGFGLYLYCCSNMDGFKLELSSAAVQNALRISDSSYRRAFEELLEHGYIIKKTNTKFDFFTTPQPTSYVPKPKKTKKKSDGGGAAAPVLEETLAAEPTQEPAKPFYSFSPHLVRDYDWEE
ncbi:MAG: hypothetical protein J6M47_05500 [Clostridia bacterium]|nr:hypothetical protein [Clostridia bacterium]